MFFLILTPDLTFWGIAKNCVLRGGARLKLYVYVLSSLFVLIMTLV